jgi:uncharacterized protein YbaA (DUF1428 family)
MENKIESSMEIEETGNYLQHFIYRVPKKNHDAIEPNLRKFVPLFKKNEIRLEDYYQLSNNQTMEAMESITKTPSITEDEDVWVQLQYFRYQNNSEDGYIKMIQDARLKLLGDEFFTPITQGKSMMTGVFRQLEV